MNFDFKVETTPGTWERYKPKELFELNLPNGYCRYTVYSIGKSKTQIIQYGLELTNAFIKVIDELYNIEPIEYIMDGGTIKIYDEELNIVLTSFDQGNRALDALYDIIEYCRKEMKND